MAPRKGEPMPVVVVDTREQCPWSFGRRGGEVIADSLVVTLLGGPFETVQRGLETGDYSVEGLPDGYAVIERKSGPDLIYSVTHERERFMREMDRLALFRFPALIVEEPIEWVVWGKYRRDARPTRVRPRSALGSVLSIANDRRIPVWCMPSRELAEYVAGWLLRRAWRRFLAEQEQQSACVEG